MLAFCGDCLPTPGKTVRHGAASSATPCPPCRRGATAKVRQYSASPLVAGPPRLCCAYRRAASLHARCQGDAASGYENCHTLGKLLGKLAICSCFFRWNTAPLSAFERSHALYRPNARCCHCADRRALDARSTARICGAEPDIDRAPHWPDWRQWCGQDQPCASDPCDQPPRPLRPRRLRKPQRR